MQKIIYHNGKEINNHFSLWEFRGIEPVFDLILILNLVRLEIDQPLYIVSRGGSARTIQEHVMIYQQQYGSDWLKYIPWNSRHLPKHGVFGLRAVDIYSKNFTGYELKAIIKEVKPNNIDIGLGYGTNKLHLDVDRQNGTKEWCYDK